MRVCKLAERPIFIPKFKNFNEETKNARGSFVERVDIKISWQGGFSVSQKQKNITLLHSKAQEMGIFPVLEISTKSMQEVGVRLSAFNLKIEVDGEMRTLESVYQSAKVFSQSGQHLELADLPPGEAKKRVRQVGKGEVVGFKFLGKDFETQPRNAFYDWLYIRAILPHEEWIKRNLNYAAYSDIEFTPTKSINCQARAVAEFHALSMRGQALECANDFQKFRFLLQMAQRDDEV